MFLKSLVIKQIYKRFGDTTTMNLSNLGRVTLPSSMEAHIEGMEFVSYPKANMPINCAMGSCNDRLNISFVRNIMEDGVIRRFAELLSSHTGLEIEEYSNNWGMPKVVQNNRSTGHPFYPDYQVSKPKLKTKVPLDFGKFIREWKAIVHT